MAIAAGGRQVERHDGQRPEGTLDRAAIALRSAALDAEGEFGSRNHRNPDIANGKRQKPAAYALIAMRKDMGRDVRVEQDLHFFFADFRTRGRGGLRAFINPSRKVFSSNSGPPARAAILHQ